MRTLTTATIGKGKAIHHYYPGADRASCATGGMSDADATVTEGGTITCKRCLKSLAAEIEFDHGRALVEDHVRAEQVKLDTERVTAGTRWSNREDSAEVVTVVETRINEWDTAVAFSTTTGLRNALNLPCFLKTYRQVGAAAPVRTASVDHRQTVLYSTTGRVYLVAGSGGDWAYPAVWLTDTVTWETVPVTTRTLLRVFTAYRPGSVPEVAPAEDPNADAYGALMRETQEGEKLDAKFAKAGDNRPRCGAERSGCWPCIRLAEECQGAQHYDKLGRTWTDQDHIRPARRCAATPPAGYSVCVIPSSNTPVAEPAPHEGGYLQHRDTHGREWETPVPAPEAPAEPFNGLHLRVETREELEALRGALAYFYGDGDAPHDKAARALLERLKSTPRARQPRQAGREVADCSVGDEIRVRRGSAVVRGRVTFIGSARNVFHVQPLSGGSEFVAIASDLVRLH